MADVPIPRPRVTPFDERWEPSDLGIMGGEMMSREYPQRRLPFEQNYIPFGPETPGSLPRLPLDRFTLLESLGALLQPRGKS